MKFDDALGASRATIFTLQSIEPDIRRALDAYEVKCESLPAGTKASDPSNFSDCLCRSKRTLNQLSMCIEDAEAFQSLLQLLEELDAEVEYHQLRNNKLVDENSFLYQEVIRLQNKVRECEEKIGQLEVEKEQALFVSKLESSNIGGISDCTEQVDPSAKSTTNDGSSSAGVDSANVGPGFGEESGDLERLILSVLEEHDILGRNDADDTSGGQAGANMGGYEIPQRLKTLHNLVLQYASKGRYEVAIPLCKQALEDLEQSRGRDHPDVATLLNILAMVYRDQGKFRDAANLLQEALEIREKAFGSDHSSVAATLNNLAVLFGKRAKYKEAEPLCKRALTIKETILGATHPEVAKQLNNLALVCQNQSKFEETELYYSRALEIYNSHKDETNILKTKNNLTSAYLKQGKYAEAEELYKEILTGAQKRNDPAVEDSQIIWMLAEERDKASKSGTDKIPIPALPPLTNLPTDDLSVILLVLKNLSALYRRKSRFSAAEVLDDFVAKYTANQTEKSRFPFASSLRK